jgi:hypothetical protein
MDGVMDKVPLSKKVQEKPKNLYHTCAMQRSGSHAICNWLAWCLSEGYPDTHIVYQNNGNNWFLYHKNQKQRHPNKKKKIKAKVPDLPVSFQLRGAENKPDANLTPRIIILRDPFNWAASVRQCDLQQLKQIKTPRGNFPLGISITPDIVNKHREAGETAEHYIKMAELYEQALQQPNGPNIAISYNQWYHNRKYRRRICDYFGVKPINKGLHEVVFFGGGGSSFDGMNYKDEARKMDVFMRWQNFKDDSIYCNFFKKYSKLVDISERLFNFNPL